jgi:hypothetical protein
MIIPFEIGDAAGFCFAASLIEFQDAFAQNLFCADLMAEGRRK